MDSIKEIKSWAENISSAWNGEDSGVAEDRAGQAQEILEAITELERLIEGMEEF